MVRETKPFYLSSETYSSLAVVLGAILHAFPGGSTINGIIAAVAAAAYAIARGLAKSGVPAQADPPTIMAPVAPLDTPQAWSPETLLAASVAPPATPSPAPAPVPPLTPPVQS